jgi:hypothetical protein
MVAIMNCGEARVSARADSADRPNEAEESGDLEDSRSRG